MSVQTFDVISDKLEYRPGEMVTGSAILKVKDGAIRSKGIYVNLKGEATVKILEQTQTTRTRTSGQWHGSLYHSRSKSRTEREYHTHVYTSSETLFNIENFLLGDGKQDLLLEEGESSYPFNFNLPSSILSTFHRGRGRVFYKLELGLKQEAKNDLVIKRSIAITGHLDLRSIPEASQAGEKVESKIFPKFWSFFCFGFYFKSKPLTIRVRTPKQGYLPGETVNFEVDMKNLSGKKIEDISAELVEVTTLQAQRKMTKHITPLPGGVRKSQSQPESDADEIWRGELLVPPLGVVVPTNLGGECRFIDVEYYLAVRAHIKGCCNRKLEIATNIIIGTCRSSDPVANTN